MTIPAWVQQHLEATGRSNPDRIARNARVQRCTRCRQPILVGLDADTCAFAVTCDPWLLDAQGELASLLTGRPTYRLHLTADRLRLDHRGHLQLRGKPPTDGVLVVAAHRCHQPLSTTPLPDSRPAAQEAVCPPF